MSTRLYLENLTAQFAPATNRGAWSSAASSINLALANYKPDNGAAATKGVAEAITTNPYDVLLVKFVSYQLWADTNFLTSDTVQWIMGAKESASGMSAFFHVHIFVTVGDTDVVRGTLLSDNIGVTQWPTTATGRGEGAKSLANNVAALAGDRIVVEVGYRKTNTVVTSFTGTINYGNVGATDLVSGSTAVTTNPGWIEFTTNFRTPKNFKDDFSAGTINTKLWQTFSTNTTVAQSGGLLTFVTTTLSGYAGLDSWDGIDLTGDQVSMQLVNAGNQSLASLEVVPVSVGSDTGSNRVYWYISGGNLVAYKQIGGTNTILLSTTYNSAVHKYFRIREAGGTTFFDYSTDGVAWTNHTSVANLFAMTALQFEPSVGCFAAEASGTTVTMTNFNILPPVADAFQVRQAVNRASVY